MRLTSSMLLPVMTDDMVKTKSETLEIVVDQPPSLDTLPGLATALETAFRQPNPGARLVIATPEVALSLVQLICSAHRSSQVAGADFSVKWQVPAPIHQLLCDAGFSRHVPCPRSQNGECLWLQENWV